MRDEEDISLRPKTPAQHATKALGLSIKGIGIVSFGLVKTVFSGADRLGKMGQTPSLYRPRRFMSEGRLDMDIDLGLKPPRHRTHRLRRRYR